MNKIIHYSTKSELWLYVFLVCVMVPPLAKISCAIAGRLPILNIVSDYIDVIITIVSMTFALPAILRKIKSFDIMLYIFILLMYGLQYVFFPENSKLLTEYFSRSMLAAVPLYFVGRIWDINRYDKFFFIISLLGILWMSFYNLYYSDGSNVTDFDVKEEDMASSYQLIFLLCYTTWYTFRNFTLLGLGGILLGVFALFSFGARGPVVCYCFFVSIYLLFFTNVKHKSLFAFLIFGIGYIVFLNILEIALFLHNILANFGMSTRILESILYVGFNDASTIHRMDIINTLYDKLDNGSQLAYGIYGSWHYTGNYSHRIYVDFFFNFGYFIGSLLIILFIYIYYKSYKISKRSEERGLWLLFISIGLIPLFFSGYFMFWGNFFLLLGYCVTLLQQNKKCRI